MKKIFTILALIVTITINAQAPQGFNYQATVRNSSGALIVSQNVYFKFNVMLNSSTSVPVYSETHYVPTDDLGAVNLVIGQGTATSGTFSTINWGTGNYYLGIELNTGTGYVAMGTTQLLSVPFALYANSSGNGTNDSKVIGFLQFEDVNANSHINTYETTQISPLIYSRYFYGQYGDLVIQGQPSLYDGKIHFVTGSDKVGQDPPTQRMVIMSNGNIGIGNFLSSPPKSKLEVQNGDVYIDNSSKGIILKSPNGNCWRLTIDDTGNSIRTNISCPN